MKCLLSDRLSIVKLKDAQMKGENNACSCSTFYVRFFPRRKSILVPTLERVLPSMLLESSTLFCPERKYHHGSITGYHTKVQTTLERFHKVFGVALVTTIVTHAGGGEPSFPVEIFYGLGFLCICIQREKQLGDFTQS
jgi:hypothetical protein